MVYDFPRRVLTTMTPRMIFLASLSALAVGCAHQRGSGARIPPLSEVEDQAPIRWPIRPLTPLPEVARVDPVELRLAAGGRVDIQNQDAPQVRYEGGAPFRGTPAAGTSLDRGYAKRFAWIEPEGQRHIERYLEVFRGSPIVSIFQRVHLLEGQHLLPEQRFSVPDHLTEVISFDGAAPVKGPLRAVRLDPAEVKKPLVLVTTSDDTEGVLFFFPHRPEVRRWYVEDYVVTSTVQAEVEVTAGSVRVRFPRATVPKGRVSFDFPIYVMSYRGPAADAVEHFRIGQSGVLSEAPPFEGGAGFWHPRSGDTAVPLHYQQAGLRMLRYFPTEQASWIDGSTLPYGHAGGYAWGLTTQAMKGVVTDPLASQALLRDQSFRMLTFFLEAGREKGAPPNLTMQPQWTKQMDDPNQIRTVVFCQYWEYRLPEFSRLLDSAHLTHVEKLAIHDDLQTARRVFDPSTGRFTTRTENGGVWFDYFDVQISGQQEWIINTHATNLANVGELALLARKVDREEDERYWRGLFVSGLDALDYVLSKDWIWASADPNELRYAKEWKGPRDYHKYMVRTWVPHIARLSIELAPERTEGLVALIQRLMKATLVLDDPKTLAQARARLAEIQELRALAETQSR